jgi:hypothetical protein
LEIFSPYSISVQKGSISKIKTIDIESIEIAAYEYWLIAKELILRMNGLKNI